MATLFDLASLDSFVYTPGNQNLLPPNWQPIPNATSISNALGFYAEAFKNTQTNEIVISIRGTDDSHKSNFLEDLMLGTQSQIEQDLNPIANLATQFAEQVAAANSNSTITITGHSLGGWAAQVATVNLLNTNILSASAQQALTTVTFNAPGIPVTDFLTAGELPSSYNAYNFYTQGDVIHDTGGVHLGQMIDVAVGPSPQQELADVVNGLQNFVFGAGAALTAAGKNLIDDSINEAHPISNFVGTNPALGNQPGIFTANPTAGAMTAAQYLQTYGSGSVSSGPQISVNNGIMQLTDGNGNTLNIQGTGSDNAQVSLALNNGSLLSNFGNVASLQSQLTALGSVTLPGSSLLTSSEDTLSGGNLFGTIDTSGASTTTVIGNTPIGLTSGLPGQLGLPNGIVNGQTYLNVPNGNQIVAETIVGANNQLQVWVSNSTWSGQLIGGAPVLGAVDTWLDAQGDHYVFTGAPNSSIGTLVISQGVLSSNPDDSITIQNFNLGLAESSPSGFMGIKLPSSLTLTAGASLDTPEPALFPGGFWQSYTLSVNAPSSQPQTITMTLTGAEPSDFNVLVGNQEQTINSNHTFSVTLNAGETSVYFTLIDVTPDDGSSDIASGATLQLSGSMTDLSNPTGSGIAVAPLVITYTPQQLNGTAAPQPGDLISGQYDSVSGTTYYQGDGGSDLVVGAAGNNYINLTNSSGDLVTSGTGQDTILLGGGDNITTLQGASDYLQLGTGYNTVYGGAGVDTIYGDNSNNDVIIGNGGMDDVVLGNGVAIIIPLIALKSSNDNCFEVDMNTHQSWLRAA